MPSSGEASLRQQVQAAMLLPTTNLIMALHAQAWLLKDYSKDPDNPNISAYLKSGAVEAILDIEAQAYDAGYRDGKND